MLRIICSGAFRSNGEMEDFQDFEILMPECEESSIQAFAMNRCFKRFAEKKFKKRVDSLHSLYIDEIDREKFKDKKPACCGKKIKSLNWDELQELAMMFHLRGIPLYKTCEIRKAREKAYAEYMDVVQNNPVQKGFNYQAAVDFTIPGTALKKGKYKGNAKNIIEGGMLDEETPER